MRAVLFDLHGTLADTALDLGAALNWVRMERGLPPMPHHLLRPMASHGVRGLLGVGFDIGPEHADFALLKMLFLDYYQNNLAVHTRLFDGVLTLLGELQRLGLPWGIVTNKPSRFTAFHCTHLFNANNQCVTLYHRVPLAAPHETKRLRRH